MHTPSVSDTTQLKVLSFEEALHQARQPAKDYDYAKWLYVPNYYCDYRYILGTVGQNPLICIGINPSTAKPDDLDNTLKSVERVAFYNGFDSFMMFNIYPQRATNPDDMEKQLNTFMHGENMKAFAYILNLYQNGHKPSVWAAWGTIIEKRPYLFDCLKDMTDIGLQYGATWYSAGKRSKVGHPHHPLYLSKTSVLEPFDVEAYRMCFQK